MKQLTVIAALVLLAACNEDETVAGYGGADKTWVLTEIDGQSFGARATIQFGEDGKVAGAAPCNRYSAEQSKPYPWFELGPAAVTRRACADLQAEDQFLKALADMRLAEVSGPTLILSNDAGREMVFKAE